MEVERHAVHTIALASRFWSVLEDMTQMPTAAAAMNFGSRHEKAAVRLSSDCLVEGRPEAGPTSAAVKLGIRLKHRLPATGAMVEPGLILHVERARARTLGAVFSQHPVLCRRQFTPPLFFLQGNRKCLCRRMPAAAQSAEQTLCHAFPFGLKVQRLAYRIARVFREGDAAQTGKRSSVHPLVFTGDGAQQLRRRASYPTPDDAGQLVIPGAQALRFAMRDFHRRRTVPANEKQCRFPDLTLVGHHRRGHHNRKAANCARVPSGSCLDDRADGWMRVKQSS